MSEPRSEDEFDSEFDDAALLAAAVEAENAMFNDFDESLLLKAVELTEVGPQQTTSNQVTPWTIAGSQRQKQTTVDRFFSSSETSNTTSVQSSSQSFSPALNCETTSTPYRTHISAPTPQAPPPPPSEDAQCAHFFDREACTTWVYPINYPLRTYQFNIVQRALFNNTLVAMPTGLGKTFIAAVVMFNYYRWFPTAKIVFMAPTKPLVNQQIEACFKICGIPQDQTAELTGAMPAAKRKVLWNAKRMFFVTPQILQNDITEGVFPVEKLACLVVDEAHKATGGYAYAVAVRKLKHRHKDFRILALTATPGTSLQAVQKIVDNLLITNIQVRTEDSLDIQEFSHGKSIQTVVVSLSYTHGGSGMLPKAVQIFRHSVFIPVLKALNQFKAINDIDPDRNTPYMLMQSRGIWQANSKSFNKFVQNTVFSNFLAADILSRAHDLLCQHGTGPFLRNMKATISQIQADLDNGKHVAKSKVGIARNPELHKLLRELERMHEQSSYVGHPKMDKLLFAVLQHLNGSEASTSEIGSNQPRGDTRIMIFSSLRESVNEIVSFLSKHEPMIRCTCFVGQAESKGSKGLNQKAQQEVIGKFKRGVYNVLVSTSIGEEGLDIGEVDLIICYDSQSSPIRMIQRLGRTGRKRKGKCLLLLTELEERKYKQAKDNYKRVQNLISRPDAITYYPYNPVILPDGIRPVPDKQVLNIGEYSKPQTGKRKRNEIVDEFNSDGTLGLAQEDEFRRRFLQPLINGTETDADVIKHWMHPRPRLIETIYTPLQTTLSTSKLSGSKRSIQFVQLVTRMEQRILQHHYSQKHQDEETDFEDSVIGSSKKTLVLPTRRKNARHPKPAVSHGEPSEKQQDTGAPQDITFPSTSTCHQDVLTKQDIVTTKSCSDDKTSHGDVAYEINSQPKTPSQPGISSQTGDQTEHLHDKPSFVLVHPDDSGIFGASIMESPVRPVTRQPTNLQIDNSTKSSLDSKVPNVNLSFNFNDQIVPLFSFELKENSQKKGSIERSFLMNRSEPLRFSAKAHAILIKKWDTLQQKSRRRTLKVLSEALRHINLTTSNASVSKPGRARSESVEFDDIMLDMDDLELALSQEHALASKAISKNTVVVTPKSNDSMSTDDEALEFDLGELDIANDPEFFLTSDDQVCSQAQTTSPRTSQAITPLVQVDQCDHKEMPRSAQSKENIINGDGESFYFDVGELDLTMLENKIDLEGGFGLVELTPARSLSQIPEIITLSSQSEHEEDNAANRHDQTLASHNPALDSETCITPVRRNPMAVKATNEPTTPRQYEQNLYTSSRTLKAEHVQKDVISTTQDSSPLTRRFLGNKGRRNILFSSSPESSQSDLRKDRYIAKSISNAEESASPESTAVAHSKHLKRYEQQNRNPFFDLEASESGEGDSSEMDEAERSSFLDSFIDDTAAEKSSAAVSQNSSTKSPVNMYAFYRQSLLSPDNALQNRQGKPNFTNARRPRYLQRIFENWEDNNNVHGREEHQSVTDESRLISSEADPFDSQVQSTDIPDDEDSAFM